MTWFDPICCVVDPNTGVMTNATRHYEKRFRDLEGLYADEAAYMAMRPAWDEQVVYEVHEFRPSDAAGDLIFGTTRMLPGQVGDEYFLTRGHLHRVANRPEFYLGQHGIGLMLMESPAGDIRIVEIVPHSICYVPPYWIHRSVNPGTEDFVMTFCYPADSGQDYDIIAQSNGMKSRIMVDGQQGWVEVSNAVYQPRDAAAIAHLLATAA